MHKNYYLMLLQLLTIGCKHNSFFSNLVVKNKRNDESTLLSLPILYMLINIIVLA